VDFVVQVRDREHVRRVIAAVRGVANVLTADSRSSRRLRSPEAALPAGEASPPRRRGQRMPN